MPDVSRCSAARNGVLARRGRERNRPRADVRDRPDDRAGGYADEHAQERSDARAPLPGRADPARAEPRQERARERPGEWAHPREREARAAGPGAGG